MLRLQLVVLVGAEILQINTIIGTLYVMKTVVEYSGSREKKYISVLSSTVLMVLREKRKFSVLTLIRHE